MIPDSVYGAYLDGYRSAALEVPCQLNPYWALVQPSRHMAWDEGHRDRCEDERVRREGKAPTFWTQFDDEQFAAVRHRAGPDA